MSRRPGPPLPWVCLITDHASCDGGYLGLERAVGAALQGGVNVVQLREKALPPRELLELGRRLRRLTSDAEAALLINDRADLAVAVNADGVHLGGDSLPIPSVREVAGDRLVGRSVHGVPEAVEAERLGADYLFLGTIFPSETHPEMPAAGPHLIRKVKARITVPIIAIGGVTPDNAAQTISHGAGGVAVIRAILRDPRPEQAARRLVDQVKAAWLSAILHRGA